MPTDFGQFMDDTVQDRQNRATAEKIERLEKEAEANRAAAALAAPLDAYLEPALASATESLKQRGVEVICTPTVGMSERGDFKVLRFFKLERKRHDRGRDMSSIYGFRVYPNGNVEGIIVRATENRLTNSNRISFAHAADFTSAVVDDVIKAAITELVNSAV